MYTQTQATRSRREIERCVSIIQIVTTSCQIQSTSTIIYIQYSYIQDIIVQCYNYSFIVICACTYRTHTHTHTCTHTHACTHTSLTDNLTRVSFYSSSNYMLTSHDHTDYSNCMEHDLQKRPFHQRSIKVKMYMYCTIVIC